MEDEEQEVASQFLRVHMTGVEVAWFPGDPEYDPASDTGEYDPPGWVVFARLSDGTLSYPAGSPRPFGSHGDALGVVQNIHWTGSSAVYREPPPQKLEFVYAIEVVAETQSQADQVVAERLEHEEDYGFSYEIRVHRPEIVSDHRDVRCRDCGERLIFPGAAGS